MGALEDYSACSDAELALICRVRPPVTDAWNVLYRRFRAIVDARIRRMSSGISDAEAEELRQQIFLRVFVSMPSYNPGRASLSTFIARITASIVIDGWRHQRRERESTMHLQDRALSPVEEASERMDVAESVARAAADSFENPHHRRIGHLLLDGEKGLSIAARTGAKLHLVYTVSHKLEQKIRTAFRENAGPGSSG